jgi:hypothetical protein
MHGRYHRGDPRDGVGTVAWENLRHLDVGDRLEPVVGGTEQHAAQPRKAARDLEIDDLQRSVRQVLRRAEPTICRDVEGLFGLASMHEIAPCHKSSAALVHICQDCKPVIGQGDEDVEFPGKGAAIHGLHPSFQISVDTIKSFSAETAFDQSSTAEILKG